MVFHWDNITILDGRGNIFRYLQVTPKLLLFLGLNTVRRYFEDSIAVTFGAALGMIHDIPDYAELGSHFLGWRIVDLCNNLYGFTCEKDNKNIVVDNRMCNIKMFKNYIYEARAMISWFKRSNAAFVLVPEHWTSFMGGFFTVIVALISHYWTTNVHVNIWSK